MKTLIVAFALMMVCITTRGQTHKTKVVGKESDSNPVVSALKAKLGGTHMYELTEKDIEVELYIDVQCARLNTGLACDATYFYYPPELGLTRLWLGASLHTGSDPSGIAQGMFEFFVNDSSEAILAKKEADHVEYIRYACAMHGANHDAIKPDAVKSACMGRTPLPR
jgi:hypothetical protein